MSFEALAVRYACSEFKPTILGYPVTIITDHEALKYVFSIDSKNVTFMRAAMDIREFNPIIQHRAGKAHGNADMPSRLGRIGEAEPAEEDAEDFIEDVDTSIEDSFKDIRVVKRGPFRCMTESGPVLTGPYHIDADAGEPRMYTTTSPTPQELADEIAQSKAKEQQAHATRDEDGVIHIDSLKDLPVDVLVHVL